MKELSIEELKYKLIKLREEKKTSLFEKSRQIKRIDNIVKIIYKKGFLEFLREIKGANIFTFGETSKEIKKNSK